MDLMEEKRKERTCGRGDERAVRLKMNQADSGVRRYISMNTYKHVCLQSRLNSHACNHARAHAALRQSGKRPRLIGCRGPISSRVEERCMLGCLDTNAVIHEGMR